MNQNKKYMNKIKIPKMTFDVDGNIQYCHVTMSLSHDTILTWHMIKKKNYLKKIKI